MYSNVILRAQTLLVCLKLFSGFNVVTVQFSYGLCKVVNSPSVASVAVHKKMNTFTKEFLLKRWIY